MLQSERRSVTKNHTLQKVAFCHKYMIIIIFLINQVSLYRILIKHTLLCLFNNVELDLQAGNVRLNKPCHKFYITLVINVLWLN